MNLRKGKLELGFTLIEMMIVVAIMAAIAAIAIPQYKQYVIRGNRAAAQSFMIDVASRQKQYLLDARAYIAGDNSGTSSTLSGLNMVIPKEAYSNYDFDVAVTATPSFTITATPIVGKPQENDGYLTLDETGAKCWESNGACPNHW